MVTISVAMATYNGERFLAEQLDSLATQRYLPHELHIGDDGSTDDTFAIVEAFRQRAPFPVFLHRNPENLGYGENFIRTAQRCSGDWIAFCDQDDVWKPEKLETCARLIEQQGPELGLIAHDAVLVDERLQGEALLYGYPPLDVCPRLSLAPDWSCLGFTQVFRASLLNDIPSSPRVSIKWHSCREAHDVWVALLANVTSTILLCGEPLVLYRRHEATVTVGKKVANPLSRLAATLGDQSEMHLARAEHIAGIAELLRGRARLIAPDLAAAFLIAADRFDAYAGKLALRGEIYRARTIVSRLARVRRLHKQRAYTGTADWPFGARALIKDLVHASLPLR